MIIILLTITALIIIGVIIGTRVHNYLYKPVSLELTEVARINTEKDLGNGGYWSMVYNNEHSVIKQYDIELPEVDFGKYNLVFSTGREIKELTYKRGVTLPYGKDVYKGFPVFKRDLYPHTIFFYKVEKIKIHEDDFSKPEEIKIQD